MYVILCCTVILNELIVEVFVWGPFTYYVSSRRGRGFGMLTVAAEGGEGFEPC